MRIIKTSSVSWVDLKNPTFKEIHSLIRDFSVHPQLASQLKDPSLRPTVESVRNVLYVVLHFPLFDETRQTSQSAEVDFIVTPTTLFTASYQPIEPLELLLKRCSSIPYRRGEYCLANGPFFLFYYIVKELFNFSLREIDHIHQKINLIEQGMAERREKEMVSAISLVRRDIINFSSTLEPQQVALESLLERKELMDEFTRPYVKDLIHEYHKVLNLIRAKKETIEALHDTNQSLLDARTNEIMKTLTIMAFTTFPLMLFASLFSINSVHTPIIGTKGDFWIIVGIMVAATIGFFAFFKWKKWI